MNREFLKEAIADAKAVKESAIANAKAALEESFTPHLMSMLSAKINEMEEDEVKEEEEMYEAKTKMSTEKMEENFDVSEMYEKETMEEEEMDLDEILAELEKMDEEEQLNEVEEEEEFEDSDADGIPDDKDEMPEGESEESEEEIDLENMSEEDLKSFIESVIADMVEAGELEAGHEGEEEEEEESEEEELEMTMEAEEKDLDEAKEAKYKAMEDKMRQMEEELNETRKALKTVKTDITEVNLLNAKLLYTNKIFRNKNLTESQKVKVLGAFDKAASVKEAKLVFETISESLNAPKKAISESVIGRASKSAGTSTTTKQPIVESNEMITRFQKLAGII